MNHGPQPVSRYTMPSHGVEIIDGIPVILKGSTLYAFQHGLLAGATTTPIVLGTYDIATKKATWADTSLDAWVAAYRGGLVPQSRK